MNIILEEKLVERSNTMGAEILSWLKSLESLAKVGQVRGLGMLFSIQYRVSSKFPNKKAPLPPKALKLSEF